MWCFCYRMKRKFYSWEECMNLREVKVSLSECCTVKTRCHSAYCRLHLLAFSFLHMVFLCLSIQCVVV